MSRCYPGTPDNAPLVHVNGSYTGRGLIYRREPHYAVIDIGHGLLWVPWEQVSMKAQGF